MNAPFIMVAVNSGQLRAATRGLLIILAVLLSALVARAADQTAPTPDWLVDPSSFKAQATENKDQHVLLLDNGLARRVIRLAPNAATIDLQNLTSGYHYLRATAPEARVKINGVDFAVGGDDPQAYQFTGLTVGPTVARFPWKKRLEWMAHDLAWPPPGKHVALHFHPAPAQSGLPEVEVHYEIYDGIPLFQKWLELFNKSDRPARLNRFVCEELPLSGNKPSGSVAPEQTWENLYVETDYAFGGTTKPVPSNHAVVLTADAPGKPGKEAYTLRCQPSDMGPDVDIMPNERFVSLRAFVLLQDGSDRERSSLARRRMFRTVAPWTAENPFMFHKLGAKPQDVHHAIDQAADVGFDLVIMSFGSGFNFETRDPKYIAPYKELTDYGKSKGIVLGGYSLLASRGAATGDDNTQRQPATFGVMPCLGAKWGHDYLETIRNMCEKTGFGVFEHDGSYPGDRCAATNHPYHHGLDDSQWVQWKAITSLYQWCTANGVYLNVPDWYFLAGSTKCAMGYNEADWSQPRDIQMRVERIRMFDGTWYKTASMGWMFLPLSEYEGGGKAATIEPLDEHREHYNERFADLVGFGAQACFRGPRLFDSDATKAIVKHWTTFYKTHREVLDGDIIHLRRADDKDKDWDGIVHVNPQGLEKAIAFFYNPLDTPIEPQIAIPLYYAGLSGAARASIGGAAPQAITLDSHGAGTLAVKIPAHSHQWVLFTGSGQTAKPGALRP